MLEKPGISPAKIAACLQAAYGVTAVQIIFLPLGADQKTAVYRTATTDETAYFLKLRGAFLTKRPFRPYTSLKINVTR